MMAEKDSKEKMKSLSKINNLVSNGKVGAGGAVISLVLTIAFIILESRKQSMSTSLQQGDEIFLACSESGNIYHNNEKTQSFLTCFVTNMNHRKTWSYPKVGSSTSEDQKFSLPATLKEQKKEGNKKDSAFFDSTQEATLETSTLKTLLR